MWASRPSQRLHVSNMLPIVAIMLVVQSLYVTAQPFQELTNNNIKIAVALWTSRDLAKQTKAAERYNNITYWDVSKITRMPNQLFDRKSTFNADLSGWDVSKNENMAEMFCGASLFNSTLGKWDTSKVKNMYGTFGGAFIFNSDVSLWCVEACVCVMRVRMRVRVTLCVCALCVVRGAWCVVRGAWCVVRGACACACACASAVRGLWCVVRVPVYMVA